MVALSGRAQITVGRLGAGLAVDAGVLVVGVTHARGGQFGVHRIQQRAGFGIQPAADLAHPVGLLFADGQIASPGPVLVGQLPVLVEQHRQSVGALAQLFRLQPARRCGQVGFGGLPGGVIDEAGQLFEELADDLDVLGADLPAALRGGRIRQHRRKRFTADRGAWPQILGFADAPIGFLRRDPQQCRQRRCQRRLTQLISWHLG